MKNTILRYGAYAGIAELVCFFLIWLAITVTGMGHTAQGYISYINIFCPLLFVYFGMRYYRDKVNGGSLSFLAAIKIGLLIVIIPTLAFAVIETVYVTWIEPDFYKNVFQYDIEQYRKTLAPAQFALKLQQMNRQLAMANNPVSNFISMIMLIGGTGVMITLISAVFAFKKPGAAAEIS